jgi:hypothetical protein
MDARVQSWRPGTIAAGLALAAAAALAMAAAGLQLPLIAFLAALVAGIYAALSYRFFLRWEVQVALIVLTILWVPLGRYDLGGGLPVHLEPYRLLVAGVVACWVATLASDRSMRWQPTGLFGPLLALTLVVLVSVTLNTSRIDEYDVLPNVIKSLSLFASWIAVLLLVSSVITRRDQVDTVVKVLVGGGAVVGFFAIVQYRTGYNAFDHLSVFPILDPVPDAFPASLLGARGEGTRVYASAEHPIALSAAMVVLLPIGLYAAKKWGGRIWWGATALIAIASFTAIARTGTTMLIAVVVVMVALRPREVLALWKWAIPFLIAVYLISPGALGGLKSAFFPEGGLIAEQESAYSQESSNRLADVGPALEEWSHHPLLGYGYGTRVADPSNPNSNALILDDQWLNLLLDTGVAGVAALLWLFGRSIRRLGRAARKDSSPDGWLLVGLAASIAAFAVGMFTFDAFSFGQVTFLAFVLIGLSVPALRLAERAPGEPA